MSPAAAAGAGGWPAGVPDVHPDVGTGPHVPAADLRDDRGPLRLLRAWPRHPARRGSLLAETVGDDGRVVAVQIDDGRVHVVRDDPRLPGLRSRHARAGELCAHRPGKRAVLRVGDGTARYWVKIARPAATARAAERVRDVAHLLGGVPGAPVVPAVLEVDATRGVLVLSPLAGVDLATLIRRVGPEAPGPGVRRAGEVVGDLLATLSGVPVATASLPAHDLDAEAGVLLASVADAVACDVVRGATAARLVAAARAAAAALRALPPAAPVLAHRDLHDGQVLLGTRAAVDGSHPAARPGLLDLDTAALADPALDAGNLLAHLDLAAACGHTGPARAVAAGLVSRLTLDVGRVQVLRRAAALRLCAVHAYRPAVGTVVPALLAGDTRVAPWD